MHSHNHMYYSFRTFPGLSGGLLNDNIKAARYLQKYGYVLQSKMGSIVEGSGQGLSEQYKNALRKMQEFAGIPQTGVVDRDTLELMGRPRCGVKDIIKNMAHRLYFPLYIPQIYRLTEHTTIQIWRALNAE